MLRYQLLPPLSEDEYASLKADIEARGVLVPVEYDDHGKVLDGHHRVRACAELGITDWPRVVRPGLSEDGKRLHARQLNLARRHLDRAQKRELIAAQLKDTPEKSNRQIAEGLKVDHKTVQSVRSERESIGEIPQCSRETRDGRSYPAERKSQKPNAGNASEPRGERPRPKSGSVRFVPDPEFQAEADAAKRDLEIERDERIALSGAGELAAENEKLTKQVDTLTRRVNDLVAEVGAEKRRAKMWKERALEAGWKGQVDAA